MRRPSAVLLFAAFCLSAVPALAQQLPLTDPTVSSAVPREQEVTLTYANRPIIVLRARLLTRLPADRAAAATQVLDRLVARGVSGPVETREVSGVIVVSVKGEGVFAVLPADVDVLAADTLQSTAAAAAARLRPALLEATELHTPRTLVRGTLASVAITVLLVGLLWVLMRTARVAAEGLTRVTERRLSTTLHADALRVTRLPRVAAFVVNVIVTVAAGVLLYLWVAFVLRQFPYTRPWGESLRSMLLAQVADAFAGFAAALPGLVTVAVIVVVTRAIAKAISLLFASVEKGRMTLPGVYPDTAVATRRLAIVTLWLLAATMAYPHIPGSESSAFKGLSVFVGIVISLGSSGVMQHMMSGLMLTFSRSVHVGDFARIGDVVGTVAQIGALATKIRTPYGEEVTIPNAVVVSQVTTNYSKAPGTEVPFLTTSVTIGYDTPWRQVEGLLLTAARQTPGVLADPKPFVWREGLEDYYVKYTLLVAPANPCQRASLLDGLHVRILDAFNEYGVQIMSPHYMTDPRDAKVVPPSRWHAAPAEPPSTLPGAVPTHAEASRHS